MAVSMKNFAWCMLMIAMVAGAFVACKHCVFGGEEEEKKENPSTYIQGVGNYRGPDHFGGHHNPNEGRPTPGGLGHDHRTY
jgi:hypothetical protein